MASTVVELLRRRFGGNGGGTIVEYIENPSTAYIDTGVGIYDVGKLIITFSHHTGGFITGYNSSVGQPFFMIFNNIIQWVNRPSGFTINNGNKHTIELSSGVLVVDGTTYTFTGGTISSQYLSRTTYICADGSLDSRRSKCRIYAFDILDANNDYLFKGRPDFQNGKYGLKDAVSGNFFSSASNVEFNGA